ncbi:hypothetical protein ACHAWF_011124 [Thalassiosira exigua]
MSLSPSSTSSKEGGGGDRDDAITVALRPSTLLHPRMDEVVADLAQRIREDTAELLNDPRRASWLDAGRISPEDVGVVVKIAPPAPSGGTSESSGAGRSPHPLRADRSAHERGPALRHVRHVVAVHSCKGGVGKSTVALNLAYALAGLSDSSDLAPASAGGASSKPGARVGLVDLDVYGPSLPLLVKPADPAVRRSPPEVGEGMVEPIEHEGVKLMSLGWVSPNSGVPGSGGGGSQGVDGSGADGDDGGSAPAVLRGPMAGRVVNQLLRYTNWGDLDVLILDLPPGTGDVQLEVCQSLSLSGTVAVSTPSKLARADTRKGVRMMGEMGVRTLAVVENMAYFVCEGGGRHYPFGKPRSAEEGGDGALLSYADSFLPKESHAFRLPISPAVTDANESGVPLCLASLADDCEDGSSSKEERETFARLAKAIAADLLLLSHGRAPLSARDSNTTTSDGAGNATTVTVDGAGDAEFDVPFTQLAADDAQKGFVVRLFSAEGGLQRNVAGLELRTRDPRTGEVDASLAAEFGGDRAATLRGGCSSGAPSMVQHHSASGHDCSDVAADDDGLFPARITKKGNYGYEVAWADGAKVVYSLLAIARTAGGRPSTGDDSR